METSGQQVRVLYFGVRDTQYPRNERIRDFLERDLDCAVTVSEAPATGGRLRRYWSQLKTAATISPDYDVVILSEFSLNYFVFSWLLAKRARATHIVDFFVGLHETEVGDAGTTSAKSVRARILKAVDRGAVLSASYCFTDTDARAARFSAINNERRTFVTLPVGAPSWALPSAVEQSASVTGKLRVLYYGSYLALHGLSSFVEALGQMDHRDLEVTMVGDGPMRSDTKNRVIALGLENFVQFLEPVGTEVLADYIRRADVIVGIFGSSPKASEVIANKVWQGLYMGKIVVTRESTALSEIAVPAAASLVRVTSEDPKDIASALTQLVQSRTAIRQRDSSGTRLALEEYVQSRFRTGFSHEPLNRDFQATSR